jgi:demethylmenaquinone methyltransferase/2-methoxy-6-polyprenyl-1,4-benzoquinol methylase
VSADELDALLDEQQAYYRARAQEYDDTTSMPPATEAALADALDAFAPAGNVLELAPGTGVWTARLAEHADSLTVVDGAPEMLAINARRVPAAHVRRVQADLFGWSPTETHDVVFFAAWLSHVPPQRFEDLWRQVDGALAPGGRVFVIDELPAMAAHEEMLAGEAAPAARRVLEGGDRYRAVKVFWDPDELTARLADLGWEIAVHPVDWRFYYATAHRAR